MAQEKQESADIFNFNLEILDLLCLGYSILSNSPNPTPESMDRLKEELKARSETIAQQFLDITHHYSDDIDLIGSLQVEIH